jgi:hypothetical protein
MNKKQYLPILHKVYLQIKDNRNGWVITGSLGMALQGMDIDVHDIDIQTNKEGAYEIESKLKQFSTTPVNSVSSELIKSYLGKFIVDDVQVELMGALQKKLKNGNWEEPVNIENYREWVKVESMTVPVLSLYYEYEAYKKLGRYEKAEKIFKWINHRKNNIKNE